MIGISLICHGDMAHGLKHGVELIAGEQEQFYTLGLHEGDDFNAFQEEVLQIIRKSNSGEGVLVFVDLFGASPFNATSMNVMKLREEGVKLRVITGVNLPMLIEASMGRFATDDLDTFYSSVVESGKEGIKELFESLNL